MTHNIYIVLGLLISAIVTLSSGTGAFAQDSVIAEAKDECLVGEGADGYLHVRPGDATGDIEREVKAVNLKRRSAYTDLAKENNVTVEIAAALTAEKLIARASTGQCVVGANGQWKEIP